jgi:carbonic anhydrase
MKNLLPGLRKFSESVFNSRKPLFENLANGQTPHTLLITCSDSRIDPNLITQTEPGELFVVRNAGNIIPPFGSSQGGEEAAIEFAIDGLKVSNIVICGHSHCGAMAALMNRVNIDALPSMKKWLGHAQATKRIVESSSGGKETELIKVIEENILAQSHNLKTHPAVSNALRQGRIRIFGWVYNFENGMVNLYDKKQNRFIPSSEVKIELFEDSSQFAL